MNEEITTRIIAGEPRPVTGRERRQDERQWEALHAKVREAGHAGHAWQGRSFSPLGDHLITSLFTCDTCTEVLFVSKECPRRVCKECFPEGLWEHVVIWMRRHLRKGSR